MYTFFFGFSNPIEINRWSQVSPGWWWIFNVNWLRVCFMEEESSKSSIHNNLATKVWIWSKSTRKKTALASHFFSLLYWNLWLYNDSYCQYCELSLIFAQKTGWERKIAEDASDSFCSFRYSTTFWLLPHFAKQCFSKKISKWKCNFLNKYNTIFFFQFWQTKFLFFGVFWQIFPIQSNQYLQEILNFPLLKW